MDAAQKCAHKSLPRHSLQLACGGSNSSSSRTHLADVVDTAKVCARRAQAIGCARAVVSAEKLHWQETHVKVLTQPYAGQSIRPLLSNANCLQLINISNSTPCTHHAVCWASETVGLEARTLTAARQATHVRCAAQCCSTVRAGQQEFLVSINATGDHAGETCWQACSAGWQLACYGCSIHSRCGCHRASVHCCIRDGRGTALQAVHKVFCSCLPRWRGVQDGGLRPDVQPAGGQPAPLAAGVIENACNLC